MNRYKFILPKIAFLMIGCAASFAMEPWDRNPPLSDPSNWTPTLPLIEEEYEGEDDGSKEKEVLLQEVKPQQLKKAAPNNLKRKKKAKRPTVINNNK